MRKAAFDTTESDKFPDAFFDNEIYSENAALNSVNNSKVLKSEKENGFKGERKSFLNFLKQAFIFFPGTILLFFTSFGAAIIFMEIVVYGRDLATLPDDFLFQFALIGLMILSGTLMTWFGLGDIKNKKHFAIPASLVITGVLIGALVKALSKISDSADKMLDDFTYLIYLLPLALIVPILVKGAVDRKPEDV